MDSWCVEEYMKIFKQTEQEQEQEQHRSVIVNWNASLSGTPQHHFYELVYLLLCDLCKEMIF